jgi:hypothetical protein
MLIRFRVDNFRSIREEQELSLVASTLSEHPETLVPVESYDIALLRAAAVYGPNASGKSALFRALSFMREAVVASHREWRPDGGVPRTAFALVPECGTEPSLLAVDLLLDGVRYEYGFTADSERIQEEWLYAYPRGRKQAWFTRDASRDVEFAFSRSLSGENRAISALTRVNSLFLSAAAQNNHEQLLPLFNWFSRMLWIVQDGTRHWGGEYVVAECIDERKREEVLAQLAAADLGISGIEFTHGSGAVGTASGPQVRLLHSTRAGPPVALPLHEESRGTQTLFALLGSINWSLAEGATLLVDELDQSLHSHLASWVVRTFNSPATNPRGAQLIFNTHDTNLLDGDVLRRDQIWFTEKGTDGATRLFPLTDFRARKHENLERGYLQGRYGAVPSLGEALREAGD